MSVEIQIPLTLITSERGREALSPPPLSLQSQTIKAKAKHKPDKIFGFGQKVALAALTTLAVQAVLAAIAALLASCNCSGWSDISGSCDGFGTSSNRQPRQL